MSKLYRSLIGTIIVTVLTGCSALSQNADDETPDGSVSVKAARNRAPVTVLKDHEAENLPAGTEVVIRPGKDRMIHEYRRNGFLYAIKVVPQVGKPYYLVAVDNQGNFARADSPKMLIPTWKVLEW